MATLFERISLICRSKANALIEKFENPAELIAQTIIDAKKEYAESVKASAEVFAAEKKALSDLQALKDEKAKYETVAEKAVLAGNDDDARQALLKVDNLEGRITNAENRYLIAHKNGDELRAKLAQLRDGIADMEQRAQEIKADMAIAEATKKTSTISGAIKDSAFATFDRLAEKAQKERMAAEALSEYESNAMKSTDADLLKKYAAAETNQSVEDKLAALKAKLQ